MKLKRWLLGVIVLVVALTVAACAADQQESIPNEQEADSVSDQAEQSTSSDAEEKKDTAEESEMVSYTDVFGEQMIPVKPKHIVAGNFLEGLLALDAEVIGAKQVHMRGPYLEGLLDGIEDVGNDMNLEKILSLEPDLILLDDSSTEPAVRDQLARIAPTVTLPWLGMDIWEQIREVAVIVDRQEEAEAWIQQFNHKEAEGRDKVQGWLAPDETVSIFRVRGKDELLAYGPRNVGHVFYQSLQLKPPAVLQELIDGNPQFTSELISMELLSEFAGDYIILMVDDNAREAGGMMEVIESSAIWKSLPAVQKGRVATVDRDIWLPYQPLALQAQLEDAIRVLSELQGGA